MSDKRVKLDEETERDFLHLRDIITWAPRSNLAHGREALARIRAKLEEAIAEVEWNRKNTLGWKIYHS